MQICVIIPAAGRSSRFNPGNDVLGAARSKLDEDLGGRPVLQRTVELFNKREDVGAIVVAGPAGDDAFAEFSLRHGDKLSMLGASLCRGGAAHRAESVRAALAHAPDTATHVAVHDAARPVTDPALIDRVFDLARSHPAVVPAVPASDTIKRVEPEPLADAPADPLAGILGGAAAAELRRVRETVDRTDLWLVQTPQVFDAALLRRAYAQADISSTDDAGLVERLGEAVVITPGDPLNIKITTPADVRLARCIGGFKPPAERPTHKKF